MNRLTVLLVGMLMIGMALQAQENYPLWVNGRQVVAGNASDILGEGTVSFNAEKMLLTFNGTQLIAQEGKAIVESQIEDLTICISNGCNLTANNTGAFALMGKTTIMGDASLSTHDSATGTHWANPSDTLQTIDTTQHHSLAPIVIHGDGHAIFRSTASIQFASLSLVTDDGQFYKSANTRQFILTFTDMEIHHTYTGDKSAMERVSSIICEDCYFLTPKDVFHDPNTREMKYGDGQLLGSFTLVPLSYQDPNDSLEGSSDPDEETSDTEEEEETDENSDEEDGLAPKPRGITPPDTLFELSGRIIKGQPLRTILLKQGRKFIKP